jgi:DNA polymerase-3 subunit gamma/tau
MITIHLNNAIEEPLLQSIKIDLITYLRERLKNNNLQLTAQLKEVTSTRMAYTNKEKFEAMMEKNPLLAQLKEKFGLDPDF